MGSMATPHLKYRPAIDGLRAIAVIGVFVFHLNKKWLPGGFVGVDVFFVISGYLITSIIFKDLQGGSFTLAGFYQRRIARIFPAFFTVALVTVAAAGLVYSSQDFASAGALLTAAALSVVNVKLMFQGDYFAISPDSQPFLHYWSLSLEEQFYVFFPPFFLLLYRTHRNRLFAALGVLCGFSFLACVIMTGLRPAWAFYLLPTRAWELFAGCLLAMHADARPTPGIRWASTAGMVAIGLSLLLVPEGPGFPGWWALLPVLGAVGVLMAPADGLVEKCLSAPPLVLLGRMSYSLYLWHWPVFSLVDYRMSLAPESTRLIIKIVLSLFAATMSYRIIEGPARWTLNRRECRPFAFALFVCAMAVCVPLGTFIRRDNYVNAEIGEVRDGGMIFDGGEQVDSVILMGDSNGSMYGKLMRDICKARGGRLVILSVAAGNPLPPPDGEENQLWLDSSRVVKRERPGCLVLACDWVGKLKDGGENLAVAIEALGPYVGHCVLIDQMPRLPKDASRASMRLGLCPPFREDAEERRHRIETNSILERFKSARCKVVHLESHYVRNGGEISFADEHGNQIYHDRLHLSGAGAELIRDELEKAVYGESAGGSPTPPGVGSGNRASTRVARNPGPHSTHEARSVDRDGPR
jgi:peptidoglycan/LPS O-acetylase OafA/YrhL